MKQPSFFYSGLLAAAIFMSSCGDSNKSFRYGNYTKVDTEAYKAINIVYEESLFQEYAALNLNPKSEELATKYKNLANEVASLAIESNLILPEFAEDHFDVKAGISTGAPVMTVAPASLDSLATDSAMVNQAPVGSTPALSAEKISEKVKHSQEEIAHQLENITRNTNTVVQDFAVEKLKEFGH
ncbi:hypothetical protein [Albibacterium indicum]|uniref:hypothetical protein n=1 Tax=Albibacterium indicum TaxID=2292082 RepID=UPI000E5377FC|nr:hypothetical protein [Pedobacter indicus]